MFKKNSPSKKVLIVVGLISFIGLVYLNSKLKSPPTPTTSVSPTPKPQIVSPNSQISQLKPERFSLSSTLTLPFPSQLPIYTVPEPPPPKLDILSQQSIQLFNLKPGPNSKDYYYSSDGSIIFLADPKNLYASYSIDGSKKPSAYIGKFPPKINSAVSSAKQFLQSFSEYRDLELQSDSVVYSKTNTLGGEYTPTTNSAGANLITLSFSHTVADYPYRYSASISSPATITIGQNNQVVRAVFTPQPFPDLSQSTEVPLLDSAQILSALNSNKATVIYAPLYNFPPNVSTLPPTSITDIKIEYRYDPETNKVLPYFLLTGNFVPNQKSGIPVTILLLLPAVSL